MEQIEFDVDDFNPQSRQADRSLLVRFYSMALRDDEKSIEQGRPIFTDEEMVEIRVRGQKDNVVIRPVRPDDVKRFSEQYKHYKAGKSLAESGTPLTQWPSMSAAQVEELKYLGFHTLENLADANDSVVGSMPGMMNLKQKAKAYLELAKGNAPLEKMNKELGEKQNQIDTMANQLAELTKKLSEVSAKMEEKKK